MDSLHAAFSLTQLDSGCVTAAFCKPVPRLPWKQDASHRSQWFVIWIQSTSVQLRKALGLCPEVFTPWMTLALSLSWCTASSTFTKGYLGELGSSPAVLSLPATQPFWVTVLPPGHSLSPLHTHSVSPLGLNLKRINWIYGFAGPPAQGAPIPLSFSRSTPVSV